MCARASRKSNFRSADWVRQVNGGGARTSTLVSMKERLRVGADQLFDHPNRGEL